MRFFLKLLLLAFSLASFCYADIEKYYKKIENKTDGHSIKNIDFIYLINLDQRPEKFLNVKTQLERYGISPYRFSAIYGWELPKKVMNKLGLTYTKGMSFSPNQKTWAYCYKRKKAKERPLDKSSYGKKVISKWTTKGAVGCTLSHLSILKDAYDSGYKTIWIIEDDVVIKSDPHQLSGLIEKLDSLVGKTEWDVLYTDNSQIFYGFNDARDELLIRKIPKAFPDRWRPDMGESWDPKTLIKVSHIEGFMKIGSRNRTHSMIIRRSGMEKILNFAKERGVFLPYDLEISFIPGIQLYALKESITAYGKSVSDTVGHHFKE